jgi:hypothetical protein
VAAQFVEGVERRIFHHDNLAADRFPGNTGDDAIGCFFTIRAEHVVGEKKIGFTTYCHGRGLRRCLAYL